MIGPELGLGLVFGALLPLTAGGLVRLRLLGAEPRLRPLLPPAEPAKFAALLVFGAPLTPQLFGDLSVGGYVVVVLVIVLIRPASLLIPLIGARFGRGEKLVAAWFGPKGFASVVYGLLVLQAGIPQGQEAYTPVTVCIAFSIVAHSSTDVPIARLFHVDDLAGIPSDHDTADKPGTTDPPDAPGAHHSKENGHARS